MSSPVTSTVVIANSMGAPLEGGALPRPPVGAGEPDVRAISVYLPGVTFVNVNAPSPVVDRRCSIGPAPSPWDINGHAVDRQGNLHILQRPSAADGAAHRSRAGELINEIDTAAFLADSHRDQCGRVRRRDPRRRTRRSAERLCGTDD